MSSDTGSENTEPVDGEPRNEMEVSTDAPVAAEFDLQTSGEEYVADVSEDAHPTGFEDSSFVMEPQSGEALPPELSLPPVPNVEDDTEDESPAPEVAQQELELADPTDPGFTVADLDAVEEEVPEPPPVTSAPPVEPPLLPPPPPPVNWEEYSDEHYVSSSTAEYAGLAAELERTRGEETERMAVAASMPGVDSGLVGLDDVVGETTEAVERRPSNLADLGIRIVTGVGLLVLFFITLQWPALLSVLAVSVFMLAAGEFYAVLIRRSYHPLSIFGLLGVLGCLIGAWIWGVVAVPVAMTATIIAVALFYGTTAPRRDTLRDGGLTVLGAAWIGGFGAFAMPIIDDPDYRWLIAGAVVIVVALDVGQYFSGRWLGRRPLAPVVSPKKTVEGLIGGAIITMLLALGLSFFGPFTRMSALLLGLAAIVLGPLGDLFVSVLKRTIDVKDMGTILPGHGGILDRIDALLFVVPAAWLVYSATGLIA